ncbi:dermonecrotic toxin domain-containing protein [Pseudomonas sp. DWRC2-2]|uniref:dermonecrotic toxin domain-containing protein n=1 Tax=Pseudomonas sp. DWRC2-2 TaxID=2804567 RepID=UPI003CED0DD0
MTHVTPPYFFDEYLRPITRKQPTDRERALGLTLKDINWLGTVYIANHSARHDRDEPMTVETLILETPGMSSIALAGVFMMSPTPDEKKAVLYTPYGGIEVFDHRDACLSELIQRLKNPFLYIDLIRFLPIKQRNAFTPQSTFTLTTATVEHWVFQDQQKTIMANQAQDLQRMHEALRTLPTLPEWLEAVLETIGAGISQFEGLTLKDTRVDSFMASADDSTNDLPRWMGSATLAETLLQYYAKSAWPTDRRRTFVNPKYDTRSFTPIQRKQDVERWESLVQHGAAILTKILGFLLEAWWYAPMENEKSHPEQSRMEFFAQVMSDKFRVDLLFKRQSESNALSSGEARDLLAVLLPDRAARSTWRSTLHIEKVNIYAPYQHYVELAATLLMSDEHAYLYTQSRGLQVLKDVDDLNDTLLSMLKAAGHQDELLNFLSLEERSAYLAMRGVQVYGQPAEGSVFGEMAKGIYDKQMSNLEHALTLFRRSDGAVNLTALLDCSLDIRHMLDSRLLELDTQGRWSLHPVSSGDGRPSTVQAERAKLQLQALKTDEDALLNQRAKHPTLRSLATKALNEEMKKRYLDLDASNVYINTYPSEAQDREERLPSSSVNMLEHFIQYLANAAGDIGSTPRIGLYGAREGGAAMNWNSINSHVFNVVIKQVAASFVERDVRTLPKRFLKNNGDEMIKALMHGLRSEAELRLLNHTLSPDHYAILDTVLRPDSMTRDKRHGLQGFLPDAFSLTVTLNEGKELHPLANCFVLTERGGLDPHLSGKVVLWTPQYGYEPFTSLITLRKALEQRLKNSTRRTALLMNLSISFRQPHQEYLLGPLQRIDEHFLHNRQQSHLAHHLDALDYWLAMSLGPKQLQDRLDDEMGRMAPSNIGRAKAIATAMVQQQGLPAWLGTASAADQLLHAELLEQYRLSAPDNQDYLHSLPTLGEHVAERLRALLQARFPDDALDPENILIPARVVLNGHTQSLVDFAQRHLPDLQPDNLTPKARGTEALPASLDGNAIVQLVRQLDIGKTYRDLLTDHLTADTDDARQRRKLFCHQLPWQALRHAHEEYLEERLSPSSWGFIQQIFDMPDAVARDAVIGATAMIRPMELIATPGATPAKVRGVYLIGPKANATGPLVLYAPYAPISVLKEYGTEEKLLDDINAAGPLQEWIIRQLGDPDQATFSNRFKQPTNLEDKQPEPVKLASNPIKGNLLRQLFHDNAEQLLDMLSCQFKEGGKHLWDGITSLLRKGVPMALQFIGGKLKFPLVVWRSFKLFEASAEDLQEQHFGTGLRKFIQGVATMASLRKELDALLPSDTVPVSPGAPAPQGPVPATTVDTLDMTHPVRAQLRRFEDVTVALTDLQLDSRSHVYTQPINNRNYVAVAGRVYPVARSGAGWRISLARELGPFVERNAQGQWVLDLSEREPRFGPTLSRFRGLVVTRRTERDSINIEAAGLPAIRGLSWEMGLAIDRALNVALYYTNTCQRNLTLFAQQRDPNSRVGRFLGEMFGVVTLNPSQVARIRDRVTQIMEALTQQDLLALDSERFVYGTSRWPDDDSVAFVIPEDAQRKIYLLTPFFITGMDVYENHLNAPFDLDDHARAATLIHELSHLAARTEDFAYLDSMRPFPDLIRRGSADGLRMHTSLSNLQSTALSVLTPESTLFRTCENVTGHWEDFGQRGSTKVRDKILHLTGTKTLDAARQIFMSDVDRRIDIILGNADSVTLLITHLGRQLDPGA